MNAKAVPLCVCKFKKSNKNVGSGRSEESSYGFYYTMAFFFPRPRTIFIPDIIAPILLQRWFLVETVGFSICFRRFLNIGRKSRVYLVYCFGFIGFSAKPGTLSYDMRAFYIFFFTI